MNARILIVEDEAGLVLTLEDRLRSEGYEVGAMTVFPRSGKGEGESA